MTLRLYNTLARRVEEFRPADPSRVTFYSCGPTVYDDAHIGNFRSFLAADLLRRFIESPMCVIGGSPGPRRVVHVMNITDVGHMTDDAAGGEAGEDRMAVAGRRLLEAKKSGQLPAGVEVDPGDPYAIARFYEGRFREDARRLGLKVAIEAEGDPTLMPRATEHVGGMIEVVKRLIAGGYAYAAGSPGARAVYFRVRAYPGYGKLSGNTLEALKTGEGGRVSQANQSQKEHPADFLLWKEDASHLMSWPADFGGAPWGKGYPGWHIECTAMSVGRLRESGDVRTLRVENGLPLIDLHSGGEDNIFPHHECEMAQSCCAFNAEPGAGSMSAMWVHARFLLVNGDKMSKSKGNFYTARDLFARGVEPAAVRLELIRTHYRANANFTDQGLVDCQRMIDRWRRVTEAGGSGPGGAGSGEAGAVEREFAAALHDDLNIAAAVAALNSWVSGVAAPTADDAATMRRLDRVLGVLELERPRAVSTSLAVYMAGVTPDPRVEGLLQARASARATKNFAESDRIRDELAAMGFAIKDTKQGTVEVRRV